MSVKNFSFKRYTPTKRPKKEKPIEATTENGTPIKKKRGRPIGWRKNPGQNENTATTATVENDSITTQNVAETEEDSVIFQSPTKKRGRPLGWRKNPTQNESTTTIATIENDYITTQNVAETEEDSVIFQSPTKKRGRPVGWRKNPTQNENTTTIENGSITTQNITETEEDSISFQSPTKKRGRFSKLDSVDDPTQDDITNSTINNITNNTTSNNNEDYNLAIVSEPKKKAGRPKGSKNLKTLEKEANQQIFQTKEVIPIDELTTPTEKPGRGRGRPKKASISNILNHDPFVDTNQPQNIKVIEVDELISETNTLVDEISVPLKKRPGRPKKIVEISEPSQLDDEISTEQTKSPVKRRGRPKKIVEPVETAGSIEINSSSQHTTAKRGRKKASEKPNYSEVNNSDFEDDDDVDDYIEFDNEAYNDKDYDEIGGDSESDEDNIEEEEFDSDDEEAYEDSNINQRKANGLSDGRGRVKPGKFKAINLSGVNFDSWVEEYDPLVKPIVYLPPNCKSMSKSTKKSTTSIQSSSNSQFTSLFPTEPSQLINLRYKLMQTTQQSLANSHTTHYKLTSNYHRDNDWQLSKVKWLTNQIIYHRESIQNRGMFQKQPVITLETGLNPGFCESFNGLMARELGSLSEKFFVRYCNLKEDLMLVRGESRKFRGLVHRVFNDLAREFNPEQNTNNESEVINSINLQDYKQFINNQDTIRHDQGDHRMNLNILLLPNWERFNLSLLEQLITYLIPLQLVILLPTSTSTSDTLPTLPYTLTSRLSCLKLNFQNPWKDLEQGLNFLSDVESNGLQLGIWPLLRLGKNFLNFNYSTSNWYSEFKWCLLDYYKSNALSVLIGNIGKPNYIGFIKEDVVPNLVDSHFDMVRALPSFKYWLSKSTQSNEDKLKLIQDNTHFKDNFLIPKLQSLQIYLINYKQAFDLVVQLQKWVYELELSDTELDSKLYLKLEGLTRGLPNSSVLEILLNQVETLNFQKLSILLKSLITFVNAQKSKLIRKTSAVEKFIEYLNELKELLVKYGNGEYNLKHTPNKKLANVLSQYFKIVLQPNYEVVLNELVFVMDDTLISKTFDPNLQDLLHLDLHQPDLELTSSTSNFNPDLCILYEIYLECGRLINLYDWSKAFEDRIIAQSTGKAPSKDIIYGRFLLGLETFKLWGLVATTKRKTDHVVKLI